MPGTTQNAHGGFIPATVASTNALISELVILIIVAWAQRR
jgi:hypothetical protein